MYPEALSVVLVSAAPATVDLVRKSCANGASTTIQFVATADGAAAAKHLSDLDGAVLVIDSDNGIPSPAAIRPLVREDAVAPVVVLTPEFVPEVEKELIEAGAADVLPLTELNYGSLRRVLRHAVSSHAMQRRIARLAPYDMVTGLMTQAMFWEILGLAVRRGQRNRDFFSVLLIDFDWSALSPDIADQAMPVLFKRFSERIKAVMRASDTVAKFEKSQIIVLAESMPRVEDVQIVAAKILSDITAPTAYGDRYVTINAAIGIAIYPTSGSNPEDLLVRASDALATSMERSTNRFAFG
jgi:diguanylate cyclase (GGDEF)-like protein